MLQYNYMRTHDIFFTSDTHLLGETLIKYKKRPFPTTDDHDRCIIRKWNQTVKPGDIVYHLGDFADTGYSRKNMPIVENLLKSLNGTKILIKGNHDTDAVTKAKGWGSVHDLLNIRVDGNQRFVLCHYSMQTWQFKKQGAIHLFGHSHGKLKGVDRSMDVGVDNNHFTPIKLERVLKIMEMKDIGPNERT